MISAAGDGQQTTGYTPSLPGQGMAPAQGVTFSQPAQLQYMPMSQPNLNITMDSLDSDAAEAYLNRQTNLQWGSLAANFCTTIANACIAKKSIEAQTTIASKYYDTQDNIASYQKDVAIRQLEVQDNSLFIQRDMHSAQVRHEEAMARLEGHTQARLANISESGRNERARILSMTDAFSRRGWDNMGTPRIAA